MAEIKKIDYDKIKEIASERGFDIDLMLKDYYLTIVLYLLKDVKGIYFKGGTALHKIFLNYSRLSEDIDFTATGDLIKTKTEITAAINKSRLFGRITKDKDVRDFTRLIVPYKDFSGEESRIFIDLNRRAKLLKQPEKHKIRHFYPQNIPDFMVNTLSKEELVAEKIVAAIGRNKPRDHYDIYMIIKAGVPINLELVKKKCKYAGVEFNITKMFNKAKKLKNRWDEDTVPLLANEVPFKKVITTLANYFKLRGKREK